MELSTKRSASLRSAFKPATVIALSFAIAIAVGTVVLSLPICWENGRSDPFAALFTATSAVCVTGLVVVDTATAFSRFGEVVILLLLQIGGLGYMTIATVMAILLGRQLGITQRLVLSQSHGQARLSGIIRLTRNTLIFALSVEAIGAVILAIRFAYDANINGWQNDRIAQSADYYQSGNGKAHNYILRVVGDPGVPAVY